MINVAHGVTAAPGETVKITFPVLDGDATLPATVVGLRDNVLRIQFDPLTLQEEEALTMVLYSRADTWLGWGESREADRPLQSLGLIFRLACNGLLQTFGGLFKPKKSAPPKGRLATNIVPLVLAMLLVGAARLSAQTLAVPGTPVGRERHCRAAGCSFRDVRQCFFAG